MKFFKNIFNLLPRSSDLEINSLQQEFDQTLLEVKKLMSEGEIEASSQALLKAEAIRKKISELSE